MNTAAPVDRLKQLHGNSMTERELGRSGLAEPAGTPGETTMTKQGTETPQVIGVGHVALSAAD
jgi:hypothetical protein